MSVPARNSIILLDTNAIVAAHNYGCWNALRKRYTLHTVAICVEEATRLNKGGKCLINRTQAELASELVLGKVDNLARAELSCAMGHRIDVDAGERELLAYARTCPRNVWWLCGPDFGTVKAMSYMGLLDRMVALETLSNASGHQLNVLQHNYTEKWLSEKRTRLLLDGP